MKFIIYHHSICVSCCFCFIIECKMQLIHEVMFLKKTIKGSKWFLILATVLCLVLLVISVFTFIQDHSAFSVLAIVIVLGVMLMNFIYFKRENK